MFNLEQYIQFLDNVIAQCGTVDCLTPASNAVTRRAKATYLIERDALMKHASRQNVTEFSSDVYDRLWPTLCKREKYGVLRNDYAQASTGKHDLRFPQDGRLVPGYAKDVLAQLRTLAKRTTAAGQENIQ